jgi:hypothetical protein
MENRFLRGIRSRVERLERGGGYGDGNIMYADSGGEYKNLPK